MGFWGQLGLVVGGAIEFKATLRIYGADSFHCHSLLLASIGVGVGTLAAGEENKFFLAHWGPGV